MSISDTNRSKFRRQVAYSALSLSDDETGRQTEFNAERLNKQGSQTSVNREEDCNINRESNDRNDAVVSKNYKKVSSSLNIPMLESENKDDTEKDRAFRFEIPSIGIVRDSMEQVSMEVLEAPQESPHIIESHSEPDQNKDESVVSSTKTSEMFELTVPSESSSNLLESGQGFRRASRFSRRDLARSNFARSRSQSIFDVVSSRMSRSRASRRSMHVDVLGNVNKVPESLPPPNVRRRRRREIEEQFGKRRNRNSSSAEGFSQIEPIITNQYDLMDLNPCWAPDGSKVFDPSGSFVYWWSFVVGMAFLYNFWVIIYRCTFEEINVENMSVWFTLDYLSDLIYVLDIVVHLRTGFLEEGVLQTDVRKIRKHVVNSTQFYVDCACLLPLDLLYMAVGFRSSLRALRLLKVYRYWTFIDHTERHTNYPNAVRTVTLLHYLFAIYHWNACIMYFITTRFASSEWRHTSSEQNILVTYLHSLYLSTMTLTTSGQLPRPRSKAEYVFVVTQTVFGLLLLANALGHVSNIVTSISAARKDFQAKLDSVKIYLSLHRVPMRLEDRVIKWFDYLWLSKKSSDEQKILQLLPDKLKAEIALHVHLDTLKRVEIFQNTEAGFLCELVLRLRPILFSPGDYICRRGEVGKEMYIVNRGRLEVVTDSGDQVLATLKPGSYFGEISILNMGGAGNRRTASVRSLGYSDLFCLSKKDLWEVLKDFPKARGRLETIAVRRLENYHDKSDITAFKPRRRSVSSTKTDSSPVPSPSPRVDTLKTQEVTRTPQKFSFTHSCPNTNAASGHNHIQLNVQSPSINRQATSGLLSHGAINSGTQTLSSDSVLIATSVRTKTSDIQPSTVLSINDTSFPHVYTQQYTNSQASEFSKLEHNKNYSCFRGPIDDGVSFSNSTDICAHRYGLHEAGAAVPFLSQCRAAQSELGTYRSGDIHVRKRTSSIPTGVPTRAALYDPTLTEDRQKSYETDNISNYHQLETNNYSAFNMFYKFPNIYTTLPTSIQSTYSTLQNTEHSRYNQNLENLYQNSNNQNYENVMSFNSGAYVIPTITSINDKLRYESSIKEFEKYSSDSENVPLLESYNLQENYLLPSRFVLSDHRREVNETRSADQSHSLLTRNSIQQNDIKSSTNTHRDHISIAHPVSIDHISIDHPAPNNCNVCYSQCTPKLVENKLIYTASRSDTNRNNFMDSLFQPIKQDVNLELQLSVASTSQLPATSTSQLPAISTLQLPATNTLQLQAIITSQLPATTTSHLPATSTSQLPAASTSQLPAINTSQLSATSTSQLPATNYIHLSDTNLNLLTERNLSVHNKQLHDRTSLPNMIYEVVHQTGTSAESSYRPHEVAAAVDQHDSCDLEICERCDMLRLLQCTSKECII